ncbi:DUF5808 domain-containing protein [Paenibacillus chartarius]|uniref:DUF5808 domain-containing protein n=1 Tax=Paenibacillus chartarius TaxID=747481 RepID=A0ABV6DV35_9BACL
MIIVITVILLMTGLLCFLVVVLTYNSQARYKNGMLFAVTLPEQAANYEDVRLIQNQFRRRFTLTWIGMLICAAPVVLLHERPAYQIIYFFVWLAVLFTVIVVPFRHAFRDTLALKRKNGWYVGVKRVIRSDLHAVQAKNRRAAPFWLFAIPFAMSGGITMVAARQGELQWVVSVSGIAVTLLFMLVSVSMRRTKAKVYSMNSELNVALNQESRRAISYMWLWLAILENIHLLFVNLMMSNENAELFGLWLSCALLFTAAPVGCVVYTYRSIHAREQEQLSNDGKVIYSDDDEYWANGFTYHNPNDKSVWVSKRIGVGETINTATTAGKWMVGSIIGLMVIVVFFVSFMLIRAETTSPSLSVTPERSIRIDYPMYSYDFRIEDVEQLALVDQIPSGTKTNGEATGKYARGHFRLKELGKARMYIFRDSPPYIQIKLKDGYIFYNEKEAFQTERIFKELKELDTK